MSEHHHVVSDTGRFALIPEWLLADTTVSDRAIRLYGLLASRWADRDTAECWPSKRTIADALGCSIDTISRGITDLEKVGAIQVIHRRSDDGSNMSNVYRVIRTRPPGAAPDASPSTPPSNDDPPRTDTGTPPRNGAVTSPHERDPNQNQEQEPLIQSSSDADEPPSEAVVRAERLCEFFVEHLLQADPDAKRPTITKAWVTEAERMVRIDKRERSEIAAVIAWVFLNPAGEFWVANCRSIPKFRTKYETLRAQMRATTRATQRPPVASPVTATDLPTGIVDVGPGGAA